jgi:hypothetical protein
MARQPFHAVWLTTTQPGFAIAIVRSRPRPRLLVLTRPGPFGTNFREAVSSCPEASIHARREKSFSRIIDFRTFSPGATRRTCAGTKARESAPVF